MAVASCSLKEGKKKKEEREKTLRSLGVLLVSSGAREKEEKRKGAKQE